jgi:hypothetical protein
MTLKMEGHVGSQKATTMFHVRIHLEPRFGETVFWRIGKSKEIQMCLRNGISPIHSHHIETISENDHDQWMEKGIIIQIIFNGL